MKPASELQGADKTAVNNTLNAMSVARMMGDTGMDPQSVGAAVNTMLANQ